MLLTQSTTPIIGWIATLLGYVMQFIFTALSFFGIQNIGLCIIFFTIFVRLIMFPLTIRQQRVMKINQVMQPEINKIQKKYRNKKDQASMMKQNEEIQAVYDKYGSNPTGGCLQILIQFPIFLALYSVIRKVPAYIPQVKAMYMTAVTAIEGQNGYIDTINTIADGLNSSYVSTLASDASSNEIIDVLNYFTADAWSQLSDAMPAVADTINSVASQVTSINNFALGINVAQAPGLHFSVYLIIPILAAVFQYLSIMNQNQPSSGGNDQAASMNKSMSIMMPLMSLYFCIIMPAGMGIYWVTSAAFQFIQQALINLYFKNADMDKMIEQSREKAAKKKAKGKKSMMERLTNSSEKAEAQKKEYESRSKAMIDIAHMNLRKVKSSSEYIVDPEKVDTSQFGEIGKNAYLVARYDIEHNTRGGKK